MNPADRLPGPNIDTGLDRFWRELGAKEPQRLCPRAGVSFRGGRYVVPFLGREYEVDSGSRQVAGPPGDALATDPEFRLMLLGYLTLARGVQPAASSLPASSLPASSLPASSLPASSLPASSLPASSPPASSPPAAGDWASERQLPGGSLFFQGPHALPLAPLVRRYGQDADAFRRACLEMGGTPLPFGDAAFAFRALPLVSLGVVLWVADEEFPPRAGMLFDPTVTNHLPLDLVLALARAAILRIEAAAPTS